MYKRLRPLCCEERLTLQICIRVKTFSKSRTTSGEGKWDTGGRGWLPRLSGPPGFGGQQPPKSRCVHQKMPPSLDSGELQCHLEPHARKATSPGKWAGCSQAPVCPQALEAGSSATGCLSGRGRVEARLLCWAFAQRARIEAGDAASAW